jgi:hypothetical protein
MKRADAANLLPNRRKSTIMAAISAGIMSIVTIIITADE